MSVVEEVGKPGTNFKQVGASEKKKLSPLMAHYAKKAHPFTACVADNSKRFGPERAKRVCAVLKDLIRGTTKWRNQEAAVDALYEAAGGDVERLVEMYRDDLAQRLDTVIDQTGWQVVALVIYEHRVNALARYAPARELQQEIASLAEEYRACPGEPNALTALIDYANDLAALGEMLAGQRGAGLPPKRKRDDRAEKPSAPVSATARARAEVAKSPTAKPAAKPAAQAAKPSAPNDRDFEKQHPRGTGDKGGEFIQAGSAGPGVRAVQRAVGAKEDGKFGDKTQARVERFQKKHSLVVDGIVGKQTASAMLGNRSASKLNTGSITKSQRARLRDGGRSRARRSKILREEQEILLELSLRSLRKAIPGATGPLHGGKRRDYTRVGGGHGHESGRFSKRDIAAIGKPGKPKLRDVSALHAVTGTLAKAKSTAKHGTAGSPEHHREREKQSLKQAGDRARQFARNRDAKPVLPPEWENFEKDVPEAIKRQPEYQKAKAEAAKNTDKLIPGDWQDNDTRAFYGGGMSKNPDWSSNPVRAALHRTALAMMFKGVKPQPEGKRQALFMGGGGASGKSSLLRAGHIDSPENNTLVNADIWKDVLPDSELIRDPSRPDEERREAAGKVHEESSDLSKLHLATAMARRNNFIMDGTGDGKKGKLLKQLEDARKRGYDVKVAYATTYVGDAISRNIPRFEKEGRYIDPQVLLGAHEGAARAFTEDVLPSDFPVEIWDTTVKGKPVKIYERKSGKGEAAGKILDEKAYARFKARSAGGDFNPANEATLNAQIERLEALGSKRDKADDSLLKVLKVLKKAE